MSFIRPLQRPWWLPVDEWRDLLALHGNAPRCAVCGTPKCLSVDHIQPRKYNGADDLSNLQFLCILHNSQKGIRDDDYWRKSFYWDAVPNLDAMRTAQRRAYENLTLDPQVSEWFSQPASQIAGKLYIDGWVVAAGKTLAIPIRALAYNQLQRTNWAACRRADRILILTKEQAIRDQLVMDLQSDLVGFGLLRNAPSICSIENYNWLRNDEWLRQYDAVAACVQMFWDAKGNAKSDVIEILGKFPLIFIDEPHFAPDQVRKILDCTPRSVIFGETGSPMRRNTSPLRDYVLLTTYTYQDSHCYDQAVKRLAGDESNVTTVELDSADLLVSGSRRTINDSSDPDYDVSQLVPAANVVSAVVRLMEQCDLVMPGELAPHRDEYCIADLLYPAHAIIRCENRKLADYLCKQTQAYFEGNRRKFPQSGGWNAEAIFVSDDALAGAKFDPKKHSWMRAWHNGFDEKTMRFNCDRRCARILFVVGMAREGVSNPLCCIAASVDGTGSILVTVQGLIGRALRAVYKIDSDGRRHVPPALLDTVHLFRHDAHTKTRAAINNGIDFVLNMDKHLEELASIGDLIAGRAPVIPPDPSTADDPLTIADRVAIAAQAWGTEGSSWREDPTATDRIIKEAIGRFAPGNESKAARIKDWITGPLREDPQRAWNMTGHIDIGDLPSVAVVLDERQRHTLTTAQLAEFIRWNQPTLAPLAENPTEEALTIFRVMYKTWADERILPQAQPDEQIEDIRRGFTREVKDFLKPYVNTKDWMAFQNAAHRHVGSAVLKVLRVPEHETAGKGTHWDCTQVHVVLQRPDIRRAIQGYARSQLIKDGWCPVLADAFGISND
jgi:hypothetical protein